MKLICAETKRWTKIHDVEESTLDEAKDRLIKREFPGHFGSCFSGQRDRLTAVEIARAAGDLTEHTGVYRSFILGE